MIFVFIICSRFSIFIRRDSIGLSPLVLGMIVVNRKIPNLKFNSANLPLDDQSFFSKLFGENCTDFR